MLSELRLLLAASPGTATREWYREAILDANVLMKRTMATRRESLRRLRELYALDPDITLFRALRAIWYLEEKAHSQLALLCAVARDPILRETADFILGLSNGTPVTPYQIADRAEQAFPGRYNNTMLANIGRHAASSWQQSGHLSGRVKKVRAKSECSPASTAYALFLGYLCGARGDGLFETLWARLLDAPTDVVRDQTFRASQQGWLEYRHTGMVTEITFRHLFTPEDVSP